MAKAPRRCHYVVSTHWDREWYQTFQGFRFRLVKLMDRVLEGWRDGRLKGPFQTDGQAVLLEDYLEIRPERRDELMERAQEGKLVIGPWYAMPDEFLVSGESLVRNLRLGREVARSLGGEPSCAGFACDLFGHNSQLPQIYAGFDIVAALIWRGLNTWDHRNLLWEGADGTVLPTYRFGHVGYCTYAIDVRGCRDKAGCVDLKALNGRLDSFLQWTAECSDVDPLLLFDGCDHMEWDPVTYQAIVDRMAPDAPDDGFQIVHTSLDEFCREMAAQADRIQTRVVGELREPARWTEERDNQWLIPGVLSSRVWIKQENAACETLLTRWTEPMGVLAHLALGRDYPKGYLDVAWRWLLRNHPHDSICGCSIDQVHEDMKFRFSQCRGICQEVTRDVERRIAANVGEPVVPETLRVTLFNGAQVPVDESVEVILEIPSDWPTFNEFFGFEPKPAFRIYDAEGNEVPYQRLHQTMKQPATRLLDTGSIQGYQTHHVRVSLPARIPAFGYTTYTVLPGKHGERTRHPAVPGLATSERSMENEHLAVTIESNGTLTLTDKRTGQRYERLLTFKDTADIGDGWYHGVAVNDETYVSTASPAAVALVHDGPMLTTFRVRTSMSVPAAFQFDGMIRSDQRTDLVIDSLISLRPGAAHLEVETTVHNNALDHRLRVLLPSGAQTDTYLADTPYDVVERPIALRADNHLYRELEVETKPQRTWSAVADAVRGLAVISAGLLETAVRDLPERPLALTLFRATRTTVGTAGEPNGQLQGTLQFRYWIVPLDGQPRSAEARMALYALANRLACGVHAAQLQALDGEQLRERGGLPASGALMAVKGPVVVTATEMRGDALEIRAFNPGSEPAQATYRLTSDAPFTSAQPVNLESTPQGEPQPIVDGAVTAEFGPKQIVTLRLS